MTACFLNSSSLAITPVYKGFAGEEGRGGGIFFHKRVTIPSEIKKNAVPLRLENYK
jgi:hypothetical protein